MLLKRDDHYTHCSFTTTFQKLYNQPNLYLDRGHSEADGNEWSEHYVHPSSPHRFKTVENFYSLLSSLKSFGRNCKTYFLPWLVNKELKQIAFAQEQTISSRTRDLELANAKLDRANEELQSRQDLIAKLYSNISSLRFSSDKHAIRNYLNAQFESEKNIIVNQIASQLHLIYALSENNQDWQKYLVNASSPFGIEKEDFSTVSSLEEKLFQINIDKEEASDKIESEDSEDFGDLFDDFFGDEIYLDEAYSKFKLENEQFEEANKNVLSELDLFQPFYSLRTIQEVIGYINDKISSVGDIGFDEVPLSNALEIAQTNAETDKKTKFKLNMKLDYNPVMTTDKDTLVNVLKELFYNCVDAQATEVTVYSINPSEKEEKDLPFLAEMGGLFPQHYLRIEDNGTGIPEEQVEKLNRYLTTGDVDPSSLSTKGKTTDKGGLGTRNLDNFLLLHKGQCRYKRCEDKLGTEVHIYLERTKI